MTNDLSNRYNTMKMDLYNRNAIISRTIQIMRRDRNNKKAIILIENDTGSSSRTIKMDRCNWNKIISMAKNMENSISSMKMVNYSRNIIMFMENNKGNSVNIMKMVYCN